MRSTAVDNLSEVSTVERTAPAWVTPGGGDINLLCRSDIAAELIRIYGSHRWVHEALLEQKDATVFRGRLPVVAGTIGGHRVVVKRMSHGGMMTRIAKDAFLTASRALAHVDLAEYLTEHGIPTAQVVFVGWRRVYGLVRCEIGFAQIDGAMDADRYFFEGQLPADWKRRAESIGEMVARLHRVRFLHADLNLMNFLIGSDGRTWVLDLDKTTVSQRPPTEEEMSRNVDRLERSIRKQGRAHRPALVEGIVDALRASYRKTMLGALQAAVAVELLLGNELLAHIDLSRLL